jgi:Methyltransferase domain
MKINTIDEAIKSLGLVSDVITLEQGKNSTASYPSSFIVLDADKAPEQLNEHTVDLSRNKVWQLLFESTYRKSQPTDEIFDTTTWVSSYNNEVMPATEIAIWQQETVKRILELDPKSIWEIGCGSGLLIWQLLDRVDYFYGTDVSKDIISRVSKSLLEKNISKVKLEYRAPEDLPCFNEPTFDIAIINSVAQYFSGANYLNQVMKNVLQASKKGLFIGDIRSLAHHEVFLTSVELFQAKGDTQLSEIQNKVKVKLKTERELLIHDAYFLKLAKNSPYPLSVDAKIKRGTFNNEMSRWRYDVSLRLVDSYTLVVPSISSQWVNSEEIKNILATTIGKSIEILGIPNIRVAADVWATNNLTEFSGDVDQLIVQSKMETQDAVDPDILFDLADQYNLRVRIIWSQNNLAHVHALFEPKESPIKTWAPDKKRMPHQLTSDPAGKSLQNKTLELITNKIKSILPEGSLPKSITKVDHIPLTENGEVNYDFLEKIISSS